MGVSVITGGKSNKQRIENDFYATNPKSVEALIRTGVLGQPKNILECCVGAGHIANTLQNKYPNIKIDGIDIINRGYPNTIVADFLNYEFKEKYDWIVTNPPYKDVLNYVKKALDTADNVAMFLKLTFLESKNRKEFFEKNKSLRYVFVFSERQQPMRNGEETKGNAIAYAWFIWQKQYRGYPTIKWI